MNNHHLHSISSFIGLFLACTFHIVAQDAGNALHFQNDNNKTSGDFLSCGSPNYELKEKLTVAAWVRWTADPSSPSIIKQKDEQGRWATLVTMDKHNASDEGQFWLQHNSDNSAFEWAVNASDRVAIQSTTAPALNEWVYVVGVYDGNAASSLCLYINGVLEASADNSRINGNISGYSKELRLNIGRSPSGYRLFTGDIDEVRIWNRALTQDEIRTQMVSCSTVNTHNLLSYWNMNEGSGTAVRDSVGTANGTFFTALMTVHSSSKLNAKSIRDPGKGWDAAENGEWAGLPIITVAGAGVGETNTIVSNTVNQITLRDGFAAKAPDDRTTPVVDGNPDMTWFAIENDLEKTQWVPSSAPVGAASGYVKTIAPISIGHSVTIAAAGILSSNDDIAAFSAGSPTGSPVTTGESFPAGVEKRSNLKWGVTQWGNVKANLVFNYSEVSNITDPGTVKLLSRTSDTSPWTEVTVSSRDDKARTLTLTGVSLSMANGDAMRGTVPPAGLSLSMTNPNGAAGLMGVTGTSSSVTYAIGMGTSTLPVELTSFTAAPKGSLVNLSWNTATEVNNAGFEVQRKFVGGLRAIDHAWHVLGFVEGAGTSNAPKEYAYVDRNLQPGTYEYRLRQIDRDGKSEYSSTVEVGDFGGPVTCALSQNYPNPFNPATVISYQVATDSHVELTVYDAAGKEVATLVHEQQNTGRYEVNFNAAALSSGIYFYTLRTGDFTAVKKMMLVK
jgi:Concanavalin A-like lectin/glucanases superfamily/Secretion system C-terminal sorting domain